MTAFAEDSGGLSAALTYTLAFTRHKGRTLGDIPLDYLAWLATCGDLREPLRTYVRVVFRHQFGCDAEGQPRLRPESRSLAREIIKAGKRTLLNNHAGNAVVEINVRAVATELLADVTDATPDPPANGDMELLVAPQQAIALRESVNLQPARPRPKLDSCRDWIQRQLEDGPRKAEELKSSFRASGIASAATLRRAKKELKVHSFPRCGCWWWKLEG